MAHATDPVGPSAVGQGETPVIATVSAPYATAGAETGDTTNVVSASYVKGAYNDAIAAINKTVMDKQDILVGIESENQIAPNVIERDLFIGGLADGDLLSDSHLTTSAAVAAGIKSQRVTAVDTWGSNHTVDLGLKTVTQ